jgi:hypothetical protein
VSVRHLATLKTFERASLGRPCGGPPSALLLDRVPQCRRAWDSGGMLDHVRRALAPGATPPSPRDARAQLADLDDALLRFFHRRQSARGEAVG